MYIFIFDARERSTPTETVSVYAAIMFHSWPFFLSLGIFRDDDIPVKE